MWTCPKCGRTFRREGQSHYCGDAPQTIDGYILAQDEQVRPQLESVRETLAHALPDAEERISWSMPTYWQGRNIIHFAANKHHIGLYPGPETVAHFREELERQGCTCSKGSIRIPYSNELPLGLIERIAAWCTRTGNHA